MARKKKHKKKADRGRKVQAAKPPREPSIKAIHRNIKRLRGERGLSFRELGRRADVCPTAVLHWERGLSAPVASRIPMVAEALGVSIDELYAEVAA